MKKLGLFAIILMMAATVWGYFKTDSEQPNISIEKLVLTGSSTVAPLASEMGKRFESLHPNVRVDVQTGGSSRGVNDARAGLADIGMASRALKEKESDMLSFTIALDGISIITNQENPVTALDKQQIIDIYTGKIVNWQAVGGKDAPITVVTKQPPAERRVGLKAWRLKVGIQGE